MALREWHCMRETLNLRFQRRDDGSVELQVTESWSKHSVKGDFHPPYNARQLSALHKRLAKLNGDERELREVGKQLFQALCGTSTSSAATTTGLRESSEHSVQAMLRGVIQRTLARRGTVALTFIFSQGCDEFVGYPWELLHNGEHFLLAAGVFTLTRALLRPEMPEQCELPVYPPLRLLYIGASPTDCPPLELEKSYESLQQGLAPLIETGQLRLERLEPPTFDELVRYLSSYGGAGEFDDSDTTIPCYAVHFDGHGAFGRLCPADDCDVLNEPDAHRCSECQTSLSRVKPETYLCFCDNDGRNRYIGTESLRELFVTTDVRLAVFSACETARIEDAPHDSARHAAVDATLATALVMAQVPAVVAMPFSIHDDLSPIFIFHFYDAIAHGRTLEEALARARQAMLPIKQHSWFVPVLYRHVVEGQSEPVSLLAGQDESQEREHPLAHLGASNGFVGRERETQELSTLFEEMLQNDARRSRPRMHHVALTGPAGIGKSALAFEVASRNREKFPGGIIGLSLQAGKTLGDALLEIALALHIHTRSMNTADVPHCERTVLNAFRSLANRNLATLLLLDGFEEIENSADVGYWYRFLCSLPEQVLVLLTSRSNPGTVAALEGATCHWYDYSLGKMTSQDILKLFQELAADSGLDERIHLAEPEQQEILQEIGGLLDGYPLGAQLIFGTARAIHGKIYAPEAATRSLEEVRDELREALPQGMWDILDIAYARLSRAAQLLLPYLSAFKLPFSHQQIEMLFSPETSSTARAVRRLELEPHLRPLPAASAGDANGGHSPHVTGADIPQELAKNWRVARDELVRASFIQFDGRVYTIHTQVRNFALTHLQDDERRRVHRAVAAYYSSLPQPSPQEWLAAFEHLEDAAEPQDLHMAIHIIVRAFWALRYRGHAAALRTLLRRAADHALSLDDRFSEGQVQFCLGAILRQLGKYAEALGCLTHSLELYRQLHSRDDEAWTLYELAMLLREEGQYKQAEQHAQEALHLFREANDARGEAWMQLVLGEVRRGHGYYYDALGHFESALTRFRSLSNDEGYASALRDRGTIQEALGNYSEAMADYEESLRLFNTLGSRFNQAWALTDTSVVQLDLAQYDLANATARDAMTIFQEQGARRGEGWTLRVLGDIARKQGKFNDARACYHQAIALFNDLGDRVDASRVINSLGAIALAEGELLVAREHYEHARTLAHEQEARQLEGRALRGLGDVARLTRHFSEAAQYYTEAEEIAQRLDTPAERSAILYRRGELCAAQGQNQQALDAWATALFQDHRVDHPERMRHEAKITAFVVEHHLEDYYAELRKQYGLY
jgi:tetratricopeptide (TPR) repeat protein